MTYRLHLRTKSLSGGRALGLAPLVLALVAGGTGCFRATGETRPTVVSEEIPATGGDRVLGNKASGGPGDFYLGNDYLNMAVDGAPYGGRVAQYGAPSGGAILDIGGMALDTSYKRVPLPTDNVERLAPVLNQDPDIPLVFDTYATSNTLDTVSLTMTGHVLDPKHKLAGATWDSAGRVQGLAVTHVISLGLRDHYFGLQTTISNTGSTALPVLNVGDYLLQHGGGLRFVVPALSDLQGNALYNWGIEIPGTDFSQPLAGSVVANMVGLAGAEPSAQDLDEHQSLGILPVDTDTLVVATDPQQGLEQPRPVFPSRIVVGGMPAASNLAAGQSLTYNRRLYEVSGASTDATHPTEATGVFNAMEFDRASLRSLSDGVVSYGTFGTALLKGPLQTEVRFDRYVGGGDPLSDVDPANWLLTRVEQREAGEIFAGSTAGLNLVNLRLPAVPDPHDSTQTLPYRITIRNRDQSETDLLFPNSLDTVQPNQPVLLRLNTTSVFQISDFLSPEKNEVTSDTGNILRQFQTGHVFATREAGAVDANGDSIYDTFQPLRITFAGLNSAGAMDASKDPQLQRLRSTAGYYDPYGKAKGYASSNYGSYQFAAANQLFGAAFVDPDSLGTFYLKDGSYLAFGSHGPLGALQQLPVDAFQGQTETKHTFVVPQQPLPANWFAFDAPGPSQMSTGGYLPGEQLSSALAEGVDIVGRRELDRLVDGGALHDSFVAEYLAASGGVTLDTYRTHPIGNDPMVVSGRTTELPEATVTSFFTTLPTDAPFGGARPSTGWNLADFIGQAEGQYTVVHRPRGPQGLFTQKGVAAGVPLGTGANAWFKATGPLSNGKHEGDFDAIELLRAEGCDPADPSDWFAEFKAARTDWFNLLNLQTPTSFTKALGLSGALYSLDTPVGLARTYMKLPASPTALIQTDLSPVLKALQGGSLVASTGPLLDVSLNGSGSGSLVAGPVSGTSTLTVNLYAASWVPVDELRIIVNGKVVQTLDPANFAPSASDSRLRTILVNLNLSALSGGKDCWIVVEAGVPLGTSGAYRAGSPWNKVMMGIYPVAVTNPIFVDVNGGGYTAPLP